MHRNQAITRAFKRSALSYPLLFLLGIALGFLVHQLTFLTPIAAKIRLFYDPGDINAYYAPTAWVTGSGRLYREVFSEYPLLANLIFGLGRALAEVGRSISGGALEARKAFDWIWISSAWLLYLWLAHRISKQCSKQAIWLWLAPAPLYFTIFRYDIYPAIATFLALVCIRKENYSRGGLLLGIAIALKGYALFLLPSYFIFIYYRKGLSDAIKIMLICLAPLMLSNLIVFLYGGLEALLNPYLFHAKRGLNGESTYDAFIYLTRFYRLKRISDYPWIAQLLQILLPLVAMALRPKTFEALVHAFLVSLLGFISFSVFYSPQFVLWIIPIACFSNSQVIFRLCLIFSWATFFYFPIAYDLRYESVSLFNRVLPLGAWVFQSLVIVVAASRLALIGVSVKKIIQANHSIANPPLEPS